MRAYRTVLSGTERIFDRNRQLKVGGKTCSIKEKFFIKIVVKLQNTKLRARCIILEEILRLLT